MKHVVSGGIQCSNLNHHWSQNAWVCHIQLCALVSLSMKWEQRIIPISQGFCKDYVSYYVQKLLAECQGHRSVCSLMLLLLLLLLPFLKRIPSFLRFFFFFKCCRVLGCIPIFLFLIIFSVLYQFAGSVQGFARRVLECGSLSLCRVFNVFH